MDAKQIYLDGIRRVRQDSHQLLSSGGVIRPEQVLQRLVMLCDAITAIPSEEEESQESTAKGSRRRRMDE